MGYAEQESQPASQSLVSQLLLLTFATVGTIAAIVLLGAHASVQHTSEIAVLAAERETQAEVRQIFGPIEIQLRTIAGWAANGNLPIDDGNALNAVLMPVLSAQPAATSMLVATADGREHMLLKQPDGWLVRRIDRRVHKTATAWTRLAADGSVLETYSKDLDYVSQTRPWYLAAAAAPPNTVAWTQPYAFFTTKDPGISASIRLPESSRALTIGMDLLLLDISEFTSSVRLAENGIVAVTTRDGRVLGLPSTAEFRDRASHRLHVLKSLDELGLPTLKAAFKLPADNAGAQRALIGSDAFWISSRPVGPPALDLSAVVAIPESDFKEALRLQQVTATGVALLGLFLGGLLFWRNLRDDANAAPPPVKVGPYALTDFVVSGVHTALRRGSHSGLLTPITFKAFKVVADHVIPHLEEVAGRLAHVNDVHVAAPIDFGVTDNGQFYVVFAGDWIRPLSQVPRPTLPQMLRLSRQIACGLRALHAADLVHGNLSPDAVLVSDAGDARVSNFGISSEFVDAAERAGFVSPECIEAPERSNALSDVYALGAVMYFLVEGHAPFQGSPTTVLMKQLTEDPEGITTSVPADLENLIKVCLSKSTARRPSIDQVISELDAVSKQLEA